MATMSSHSPHASRPSTFRAPRWGAPVLLSSCHRWRIATSRKLVPFSHRSASRIFIRQLDCIPSPVVTQDGDHQFDGGEKQAGLRPLPLPQLQGFSSGSPTASPRRWSPKTVTTSLMVGRSKPGCGLCPSLSFKDVHHQCWGGECAELGPVSERAAARSFPQ
jgi:hypothetical protein